MPAARRRRQIGRGVMKFAVGFFNDSAAAEMKAWLPGIAERPPACLWLERADREGDCQDGPLWRRLDGARSRRPRFAAAVYPGGGNRDGGQLDIGRADLPRHHESDGHHNTGWGSASAVLPPPDISFASAKPLRGGTLPDSEGGERRIKFSHDRGVWASLPERYFPPFWGVRVDGDRHWMYLISISISIRSHRAYDAIINETAALGGAAARRNSRRQARATEKLRSPTHSLSASSCPCQVGQLGGARCHDGRRRKYFQGLL
jgi:hypothetical protein